MKLNTVKKSTLTLNAVRIIYIFIGKVEFSESSMNNIQSVSIISAFPIGIIMIIMIWGFMKDIKKYMKEKK